MDYAVLFSDLKQAETPTSFVNRIHKTELQECKQIDKRLVEMRETKAQLMIEYHKLEEKYEVTKGFWKRRAIMSEAKEISERIGIVRDLIKELLKLRLARTYG